MKNGNNIKPVLLRSVSWLRLGLKHLCTSVYNGFFPRVCPVCGKRLVDGEEEICLNCWLSIPRTGFHLDPSNPLIHRLVDLNTPIEKAVAYFHYAKNNAYASLIRDAKYHSRPTIDLALARMYARELHPLGFFRDIDAVMPVPIHWTKRFRRGYNQSDFIARGIAETTGILVIRNLKAHRPHTTQTKKSGRDRRKPLDDVFLVDRAWELSGKHILLVDDVITTGSTILSCARALREAVPDHHLSVLSLAATKLM